MKSSRVVAAAAVAAAVACGPPPEHPEMYRSARGVEYYFEADGYFSTADIEAVEDAWDARFAQKPQNVPWVKVLPWPFECPAYMGLPIGSECYGVHYGPATVAGEPWRCAGHSALLHEFLHAHYDHKEPMSDEKRALWELANTPVPCPSKGEKP